MLADILAS
jgi:hypothetical protein